MRVVKASTGRNVMIFMADSTDHVTGKTGLTIAIEASKNGGAFASISPTVTERGDGWYSAALTSSHLDTLGDLALHVEASGADATDMILDVVAYDGADATALGLSRIDAAISTRAVPADVPAAATTATAVRSELATELARVDAAISTRSVPADIPSSSSTATAVRSELGAELALIDAAISTRATSADIPLSSDNADAVRTELAAELALIDVAISTRSAPADIPVETDIAAAVRVELATELGRIDVDISSRSDGSPVDLTPAAVDAVLDEVVEGSLTLRHVVRILLAALANKAAGGGTTNITFRDRADSKNRISATVDASGNRTAVTVDGT
ncbi:MAG: hypothetical protein HC888_06970 [Candidatus Competibacteraceae bacterium]|nr:hypothetical protein [Candidatus Competibacteraceae bacterium]